MTWQEKLDECEYRLQQTPGTTSAITGDEEAPYYDRSLIERYLYEVSVQTLLEIPAEEAESIGGAAIDANSYVSGDSLPLATIGFLSARMDGDPAVEVSPAHYFQLENTANTFIKAYVFMKGCVFHTGTQLDLVLLVEPTLAEFQADAVILPQWYDERILDVTHQILLAMDYLQRGL